MLKNFKSALGASTTGDLPLDQESKWRRKKKAKEAKQNGNQMAVVTKSDKLIPTKSLGSKKLASVMNRLRLITSTKRRKDATGPMQFEHKGNDIGSYEQACSKFELMLEQQKGREGKRRDSFDNPVPVKDNSEDDQDNLSFYSACDFFPAEGEDAGEIDVISERCNVAGGAGYLAGYLQDSKFILPEEQCDIPTFLYTKNCDRALIDETRQLLRERHEANPDSFYDHDYKRMLEDDWTVTRFLLRRRLDPKRTAKLMEECGKFRKQYLMGQMKLWEFPREFHQAGGLFKYMPDRVGNQTLYMRIKMYRRVPEISDVFKALILCVLEECDVANRGRGTAVIFDLSECGLQNVDLGFLYWLLNSFRNYCPKGVSYIIVYNLPWFLSATCKLAMTWLSETNRRALRFARGDEIENFIARENLPDYLGGTCNKSYRVVPAGSQPAIEVCDRLGLTQQQALKIKDLFKEYLNEQVEYEEEVGEAQRQQSRLADADKKSQCADANFSGGRGCESSSPSRASTRLVRDPIGQLRSSRGSQASTRLPPLARNTSSDSLVPVVELVSTASKFCAP